MHRQLKRAPKPSRIGLYAVFALIGAEVLWGVNKPVAKLGLETVPLPLFLSVTILGAALILLPFALRDWKRLSLRDYLLLIIGSVISVSIGDVALMLALQRIPAGNASLIGLLGPVILLSLSALLLRERLGRRTVVGVLIAFVGGAIIVGRPWDASDGGFGATVGNVLVAVSVLVDLFGTLISKSVVARGGMFQVTFILLFAGSLPIALFSIQYLDALTYELAGASGYMAMAVGIVAIAAANALFMYGLKHRRMQQVSSFLYLNPLTTVVMAWILLSEIPSPATIAGALLIFVGIWLTSSAASAARVGTGQREPTNRTR